MVRITALITFPQPRNKTLGRNRRAKFPFEGKVGAVRASVIIRLQG